MQTVAIIQARMGSTRLPGKVMRKIGGRPMIDWVFERAQRIPGVDDAVVATTDLKSEQLLIEHLQEKNLPFVRGPEDDVLGRYVKAATKYDADDIVRVTSDCPLLMPNVSKEVILKYRKNDCNYASNIIKHNKEKKNRPKEIEIDHTYPVGLDTEVFGYNTLAKVDREASESFAREHVTTYIRKNPDLFEICAVTSNRNNGHLRCTVDTKEDIERVRKIYEIYKGDICEMEYESLVKCIKLAEKSNHTNK